MRKDRDIIQETIVTINRQIGYIPVLERDIRDMRADISRIADRLAAVETHYATADRTQSDLDKRIRQISTVQQLTEQYRNNMDKQISDMRQMYASSTSRINNLNLITTRLVKSPKPQHPDTNDTVQNDRLIMMEAQIQSMVSNIDTQTLTQPVRSNDLTDIEETQPKTRFTQAPNIPTAETQQNEQANGSDTTISSFVDFTGIINTDTARSGSRKVTHPTDKSIKVTFTDKPVVHPKPQSQQNISNDDEEELYTGFVVSRHKRQRFSAEFVAGIVLKNDMQY